MYTSFHVQNFRGFRDLKLDDLARINLIAGKNNSGKTSLLEALFMSSGGFVAHTALKVQQFRRISMISDYWETLFFNMQPNNSIQINSDDTKFSERQLKVEIIHDPSIIRDFIEIQNQVADDQNVAFPQNGSTDFSGSKLLNFEFSVPQEKFEGNNFIINDKQGLKGNMPRPPALYGVFVPAKVHFPNDDANRFRALSIAKQENKLVKVLQIIEPNLASISLLPDEDNSFSMWGDIGLEKLIPFRLLGDGFGNLATLLLTILDKSSEVVFIDEIENGLHYSVQQDVWKAIGQAARESNVQVFATTHSLEMIRAAHEAFKDDDPYDFRYHRLDKHPDTGDIEAVTYNQFGMEAISSIDYEVRG